jgi:hypothetical protein
MMKFYSYISNPKIDMLSQQIPRKFLEDFSGEIGVNFGILKASVKDKGFSSNRISKLEAIVRYINKTQNVGDVFKPGTYFKGILKMHSTIEQGHEIVLFGWSKEDSGRKWKNFYLLLTGSLSNLIGMENSGNIPQSWFVGEVIDRLHDMRLKQIELEKRIISEESINSTDDKMKEYLEDIKCWASFRLGPIQKYEFLALTMVFERSGDNIFLLGSPIYVAMAG